MLADLFLAPDPTRVADTATVQDVLDALRACTAEDGWPAEARDVLDFVLTVWVADSTARPNDREGVAELQRLVRYALERARNRHAVPEAFRTRWQGFFDVLEARRRTLVGRDPALILDRRHVRELLAAIGHAGSTQQAVTETLKSQDRVLTSGRLSQLLTLLEAHGLITRQRTGRENRLMLTEAGRPHVQAAQPASPSKRGFANKLVA
ncbi:MAG TPA: hypothetical protein PK312_00010 [Nitrospira sp.]|nr:hypothetical protein [Nitrospira sp.]